MLLDTSPAIVTINSEEDKSDLDILNLEEEEQSDAALLTPSSPSHSLGTTISGISLSAEGDCRVLPSPHNNNSNNNHYYCTNVKNQQLGTAKMNKNQMTLNVADPAAKPLYAITPTDSVVSMEESSVATPSEIAIGIHESDSTTKLQPNNNKNQDSNESLISHGRKENWYTILFQVTPPYLVAGLGMVAAGIILDIVQEWKVFKVVPEFLVLVTPLLGLKGNLEMTLASRLSTHANLGTMDSAKTKWGICAGNLCLIQVQAIVVGFLASLVAIIMGVMVPGEKEFVFKHALLLCTSSMLPAAVASFVLGVLMVVVILLSKRFHLNPDNIATPIAASLGDVTTLSLLAWFASMLYNDLDDPWICPLILGAFVIATPIWVYGQFHEILLRRFQRNISWNCPYVTHKNEYTREVLVTGWPPVIIAMLISSGGGIILDSAKERFHQLALYQPVINGVGGNLVSVQASRVSTALHRDGNPGHLPGKLPGAVGRVWKSPMSVFMGSGVDSVAARVLLGIVIPGHLLFSTVTHFVSAEAKYSVPFMVFYLTAAVIQVAILLYLAQILVAFFWQRKLDPDTNAIPYLTALGDLLGTGLLYVAFAFVEYFHAC